MKWAIFIVIAFACAFWFVRRIYGSTKGEQKNDETQGTGSGENGASDGGSDE